MTMFRDGLAAGLTFGLALAVASAPLAGFAESHEEDENSFEVARIYFELNDTDGDLGIHALVDGDAWKRVRISDPNGRRMLDVRLRGRLGQQGLTELFFESDEPTFDELSPEEFFERFPAGEYEVSGRSLDGERLESEVVVSQVMPAPAENVTISGIPAAPDCDAELPVIAPPIVIEFDAVSESHPDLGAFADEVEVELYELVIEREEPEPLVLKVDLPPDTTSFEVPEDFIAFDSGDGFKFEILVRAANGNQTAVESCFEVDS